MFDGRDSCRPITGVVSGAAHSRHRRVLRKANACAATPAAHRSGKPAPAHRPAPTRAGDAVCSAPPRAANASNVTPSHAASAGQQSGGATRAVKSGAERQTGVGIHKDTEASRN